VEGTGIGPTFKEQILRARRGQGVFRANILLREEFCRVTGVWASVTATSRADRSRTGLRAGLPGDLLLSSAGVLQQDVKNRRGEDDPLQSKSKSICSLSFAPPNTFSSAR